MNSHKLISVLFLIIGLAPVTGEAATLALKRSFVTSNMNRATIQVSLHVHVKNAKPHSIDKGGDDGDVHVAGRSDDVRLPLVAEVMNARAVPDVLEALDAGSSNVPVDVRGVWRIWFEHPGKEPQIQGNPVPAPATSNPDHVFEIHPITSFGGQDLRKATLVPIADGEKIYKAYPAQKAFGSYEGLKSTLYATTTAIMIESRQAGYNYTHFYLEPVGEVESTQDAFFVLANVYDGTDLETPVTAAPHRMVFVRGSQPAEALKTLQPGELLHVLGEPRVNLREVLEIVEASGGEEVEAPLPYEMVIVGVYPEGE